MCACGALYWLAGDCESFFFPKRGTSLFLIQRQNGGKSSGDMIFDGIFHGTSVKCSVSEGGGKDCVSVFVLLPVLVELSKTLHVG